MIEKTGNFLREHLALIELIFIFIVLALQVLQFFIKPRIKMVDAMQDFHKTARSRIILPPPSDTDDEEHFG